jgi:hypothetical protein
MITAKSLHHSNIIILFNESNFSLPENEALIGLYRGDEAKGSRFIDDPFIGAKVLTLPALGLRITIEKNRLRIDDEVGREPKDSRLAQDTAYICEKLFQSKNIISFGFNFDIFYRFNNVLPTSEMFEGFFGEEPLKTNTLLDFGVSFTLDKPRENFRDTYFTKITAPLEMAVHLNRHFDLKALPNTEGLQKMFDNCYNKIDEVLNNFTYS